MPLTVIVRSTGTGAPPKGSTAPFALSLSFDGPRIVLGRGAGSDVRLPDPSVSFRHATIRTSGSEYAIVDEGSTNGTWVGGVKLAPQTPRIVKSGDLVRVGRVWLELVIGHKTATPDLGLATRELALSLVRQAMDAMGDDTVAKIHVAEGPDLGTELRLFDEERGYVVGRAEKCDLPLADEDASREHASVTRRGAAVYLRDLGSRNGIFLGDQRIPTDREVVWRPLVMARIGRSVLGLSEPVSLALAELESCADERIAEDDAPPEPPPSVGSLATVAQVEVEAESTTKAPESVAPASASPDAGHAPIAQVQKNAATTAKPRKKKHAWTLTDVLVFLLAVGVIAASVAGLIWVLR